MFSCVFVFFSFRCIFASLWILVIFDFACGTSSCRVVYIVYIMGVCVCVYVRNMAYELPHDGCCFNQRPWTRTQTPSRVASTFCSLSAHGGARSSINQLISLEFMFCCGVALCSDATCPTMPHPRSTTVLFPFSPSAQSRVVSFPSPPAFLLCLPRILLHFYSCWRACFAAIASFAAMSWPCCMWRAGESVWGQRVARGGALKCTLCI